MNFSKFYREGTTSGIAIIFRVGGGGGGFTDTNLK